MPRILITRSRHQTSDLALRLQSLGAQTILIPTIDLAPPTTYAPLDQLLRTPETYDWLLFTSANAVEALRLRAETLSLPIPRVPHLRDSLTVAKVGGPPRTPDASPQPVQQGSAPPKIAAIGPATARALTNLGLPPDLVPPQAVAESLAAALIPHITPGHTRMALLRAETGRDHLPDTITAAGAHLTLIPAYRTILPAESIPQLQQLFATPAIWPDAITFTSSSTATNLVALLEAAGLTLPETILRASIGPITSQTLRDLGYPPHLEAPEASIPSLVQALARHFHLS